MLSEIICLKLQMPFQLFWHRWKRELEQPKLPFPQTLFFTFTGNKNAENFIVLVTILKLALGIKKMALKSCILCYKGFRCTFLIELHSLSGPWEFRASEPQE